MTTVALAIVLLAAPVPPEPGIIDVSAEPQVIRFAGPSARQLILVSGSTPEGQAVDLTRSAHYQSLDPSVATVDGRGVVRPVRDGGTTVEVRAGGYTRTVEVRVEGAKRARSFHFENDIVP